MSIAVILAAVAATCATAVASPPDAKPVESLIAELKDEDPDVRLAAREALRDAGAAAVPALEKLAAGDNAVARQSQAVLRRIEFDRRAAKAVGIGVAWFKWERKGGATAWVRLEAKRHEGADHGWTLVETVKMEEGALTQTVETDRDFAPKTLVSTLGNGETKNEVKAEFREGVCVIEEKGKKDELPGVGPPWTDWSVVRFAASIAADPPREPEIVVWDGIRQDPATTKLRVGEPEFTDGPGGIRVKAIAIKIEGLLTAWVKEDGTLSHATYGEGSMISAVEEKDVPEKFRK
ncbi:MAG: HEAT repeat domain-containing protein [Planctomycetes bacterium]|nr:HEAT repeat domain-containing protein [Planctomycetota bacterium]